MAGRLERSRGHCHLRSLVLRPQRTGEFMDDVVLDGGDLGIVGLGLGFWRRARPLHRRHPGLGSLAGGAMSRLSRPALVDLVSLRQSLQGEAAAAITELVCTLGPEPVRRHKGARPVVTAKRALAWACGMSARSTLPSLALATTRDAVSPATSTEVRRCGITESGRA